MQADPDGKAAHFCNYSSVDGNPTEILRFFRSSANVLRIIG